MCGARVHAEVRTCLTHQVEQELVVFCTGLAACIGLTNTAQRKGTPRDFHGSCHDVKIVRGCVTVWSRVSNGAFSNHAVEVHMGGHTKINAVETHSAWLVFCVTVRPVFLFCSPVKNKTSSRCW